ncbi:MAG: hypothetical protein KA603_13330 [Azonexus sp.]|jgi:hypothetical protein|nr:hypothetical protein [Betaproteobacteria bacterium]MBP6037105.1 hypothetical protein [Azonexus sp.]MBP6907648.1 hypothetical protein [Azonexus sp.]
METKLPVADQAQVEEGKIRDYLLNSDHADGASKARFFTARGFSLTDWGLFAAALTEQGRNNGVTRVTATEWGTRYQVDCHCPTPDGANPCIRTVWEIADGGSPRLLTAHPLKR